MSLREVKSHNESKRSSTKAKHEAKRNVIVLIFDFLIKNGYLSTAEALQGEASGLVIDLKFRLL